MNFFLQNLGIFGFFIILLPILLWLRKYLTLLYWFNVPCLKANSISIYLFLLRYVYKCKDISYRTYISELVFGFAKLFENEKIFLVWIFTRPGIFVFDPEMIEEVLASNVLIEKGDEYKFLHPWLNTGLLTSGGEKWRTRRKLLTPSFHFRILEDFISVFNEQSDVLVKKMKQVSHKEWVDIVPLITMCTLDIICNSTMGICINAQNNPESEYVRAVHEIGDQVLYRTSRPWLWIDAIYYRVPSGRNLKKCLSIVHGLSRNVIKEKKKELLEAKRSPSSFVNGETTTRKKRKAFLEMLLEHHINDNSLSEEDIREEVDTFMFEGHDTTAMAICWCLYNIGLYPNVQEKVYQEIEDVFADEKERPVTSDDIKAMKYLECVLKESLRLFPSVPVFAREIKQETTMDIMEIISGYAKMFAKEKLFGIWVLFRPLVFVCHPETAEAILSSNAMIEKSEEYRFLHPWLHTGLLTSGGDKWRVRRKLLTPSFHFRILEDFISVFNEQSCVLIKKMKQLSHNEWVDIVPLLTMCTLDIICNSTMGVSINAQNNPESEYVKATHYAADQVVYRLSRPWLWINEIYYLFPSGRKFRKCIKILHDFTKKVIKEKKQELLEAKRSASESVIEITDESITRKKRKAFLEMLLEHHINDNTLSEEDIREEVDTFMFEGHDTTAIAVCWCLYNIGLYPSVQQKLHQEIQEIFADDKERPVTSEDIKSLKYMECVLKESMRLYPSVPFIGRKIRQETIIGEYRLMPEVIFTISPYLIHRNADVYPNPEVFDPDRFLPENSMNRSPFAYVPFSGGPRNCIGQRFALMEEKTILAHILRNFKVKSLDERDQITLFPDVILRPGGPLRLQLLPR